MDTQNSDSRIDDTIRRQIEEYREKSQRFPNLATLRFSDFPLLLHILLSAFGLEPSDVKSCESYLQKNIHIITQLESAYVNNTFKELRGLFSLDDFQPAPITDTGGNCGNNAQNLKDFFELPYKGNLPQLFKNILNKYSKSASDVATTRVNNRSISVTQSSGMGMSRLADETSKLLFTIPINLREAYTEGQRIIYPPADVNLRAYLAQSGKESDNVMQAEHAIFLSALFDVVAPLAKKLGHGRTALEQAIKWAEWLKEGQTTKEVGPNRQKLYNQVINEAWKRMSKVQTTFTEPGLIKVLVEPDILDGLHLILRHSWSKLQNALVPEAVRSPTDNMCFVYFDDARALAKPRAKVGHLCRMSSYDNLCKVLERLCYMPVFFILLSTSSGLQQLAPSPLDQLSFSASQEQVVLPAFTELPFDIFVEAALQKLAHDTVSLVNVCTTDIMSHFGRSMWFVHHQVWLNQRRLGYTATTIHERVEHIHRFALDKICARGTPDKSKASDLAAIGVRVGITFDPRNQSSRMMEAQLVESHMRVVYAIPEHREFMRTGSPSEPILAEAAGRHLSQLPGEIMEAGPKILAESCREGVVARGERGELCGRLLLTIAHDLVLPKGLDLVDPNYHRPIPVIDFLRALFADSHHDTVLRATPINSDPSTNSSDALALGKQFENAYVSFSHFELARDSNVLGASLLQYSLIRGCAIQINQGQASIDAVIPIHMGGVTDPITTNTVSAINVRFNNRKDVQYCAIDRSETVPDVGQPVITIVFELGDESPVSPYVHIHKLREGQTQDPLDDLHYQLVARSHGPETFNVVSARTKAWYSIILGTGDIMGDFPRANEPELAAYVNQMMALQHEHAERYLTLYESQATRSHEETVE
ncbi:unnamed protein product [Rhizoctonia solani]|nr:unnamed protein product [Rhizoctonia solani]